MTKKCLCCGQLKVIRGKSLWPNQEIDICDDCLGLNAPINLPPIKLIKTETTSPRLS